LTHSGHLQRWEKTYSAANSGLGLAGLGANRISEVAIVQMPGAGLRNTDLLRKEIGVNPSIRQMLLRYVQALFCQISQSAASNGMHTLPQRLPRWLLMANDCAW
jgi:hypothetical protein